MNDEYDEKYCNGDTKCIVKRNTHCDKSPDGQHKWEPKDGYYICKYCDRLTTEDILLD